MKTYKLIGVMIAMSAILQGSPTSASEVTGGLSTGLGNNIQGTVIVAPSAVPAAGSYTAAQSVVLAALGAQNIRYTIDGSVPTCSVGSLYSGAIPVESSLTIKAVACYANNNVSVVSEFSYVINIPQLIVPTPPAAPSGGGGGGGGAAPVADTTAPDSISIAINSGAESTDSAGVILKLTASDTAAIQMMLANSSDFAGSAWESFMTTKSWILNDEPGDKTVYAKFKDASNNVSAVISDSIILVAANQSEKGKVDVPDKLGRVLGIKIVNPEALQLDQIIVEAIAINKDGIDSMTELTKAARDEKKEKAAFEKYVRSLLKGMNGTSSEKQNDLANFIAYGTSLTKSLGEGERAGVLNSYKAAFGKVPTTQSEWEDVIKIAIGRWPTERNPKKEAAALVEFKKIYRRGADMKNSNDNAAITIIAYGLRSAKRNVASEANSVKIFKGIYKHNPLSATDWDIVRAIAYSGAKR